MPGNDPYDTLTNRPCGGFPGYRLGVRILLTGAPGFIGSHNAETVREDGQEVVEIDFLVQASHGGSGMVSGDIRDPAVVRAALRGVDAVCHQAAMVGMGVDMADAPA